MHFPIQQIAYFAGIASGLMLELNTREPKNETFQQTGMLDGGLVIDEYLNAGEWGLATQHLLYMVYESEIEFDSSHLKELEQIARQFGIENPYHK